MQTATTKPKRSSPTIALWIYVEPYCALNGSQKTEYHWSDFLGTKLTSKIVIWSPTARALYQ